MSGQRDVLALTSAGHDGHDDRWVVGDAGGDTCLACIVDLLEDKQVLRTRKKRALSQLLTLLGHHSDVFTIERDVNVYIIVILIGMLIGGIDSRVVL